MRKNLILFFISIIIVIVYVLISLHLQNESLRLQEKIPFKLKSIKVIDIESIIMSQFKDNDMSLVIGDWELWRYPKPKIENKEKKKFYPRYKVQKKGNREFIVNLENKNEIWEFYGIFIVDKKPFAIFYNPKNKVVKYKILTQNDKLNENLIIDKITPSKIIVKYPISEKKYESLELKVFFVDLEQFKKKLKKELKK